jgi:hypothetical protein
MPAGRFKGRNRKEGQELFLAAFFAPPDDPDVFLAGFFAAFVPPEEALAVEDFFAAGFAAADFFADFAAPFLRTTAAIPAAAAATPAATAEATATFCLVVALPVLEALFLAALPPPLSEVPPEAVPAVPDGVEGEPAPGLLLDPFLPVSAMKSSFLSSLL